ncbi:MAG: PDZ domain-containing protein [Acidobacteria bacterium]|nr:PDZ domain-containing protein [Acidobacteriota bacterium]
MMTKKMLLFSASILFSICLNIHAQQGSYAAAVAQNEGSASIGFAASNGNYLGVSLQDVTRENMARYNLREPRGVVVTGVWEDSPASRSGLKAGDVILRFDGEQVANYSKLQRLISEAAAEQNVRLTISRGGAEQEISITLGRRKSSYESLVQAYPNSENMNQALEQLKRNQGTIGFNWGRRIGITTTQLTKQLADYFGVGGGHGVLVTSVTENSPASRAGLKAGDVITDVDGEKVESSGDLSRAINRKTDGAITLRVVRDRNTMSIPVTPEKQETGSISITPDLIGIEPIEIIMPTMDIGLPQVKPIKISPIRIKVPIKLKPKQLEQLRKLERLNTEELMTL